MKEKKQQNNLFDVDWAVYITYYASERYNDARVYRDEFIQKNKNKKVERRLGCADAFGSVPVFWFAFCVVEKRFL